MKIRKNNIIWLLILVCGLSFGQTETELRISELIEKLNWETLPITCNYSLTLTESDSIANKLVDIGKQANRQLLKQISNPEKSIGIHIILTRINEPKTYKKIGLGTKYIYQNCNDLIGWHYVYNGIVWDWFEDKGQNITETELKKIKDYWTAKLTENIKISLSDYETIFKLLTESDNEKYPCIDNRNYENNSANLKVQELISLLGKSSQSQEVNDFMARIGNDSIHKYFNDSYFINYDSDGISLKFKKDSTLNCIFLEKEYEGAFWGGIKMDFKKNEIERKYGKPKEKQVFGGGMENFWYTEPKFQIQFNTDGIIKYIMINK